MSVSDINDESFRDTISIVNKEGGRKWIYPKKPKGKFYNSRTIVSIFLLAFLFGMPFIKINGHPFMLFDIVERHFIVFGLVFTPQDFYLFVLLIISVIVALIVVTVIAGRIFCGWMCPQTIFLEMVFRKIEYLIEGDYTQQIALNNSSWNSKKVFKKFSKYSIFFILSFIIANTFLAYIIGIDKLWTIVTDSPSNHTTGLSAILIFTAAFYFVFAWFREQACIMVCPYGRLQSVLLDRKSVVIAYDYVRGEPRGKLNDKNKGDCIDCGLCVRVCPTGIDIRNGTQLECVNCTACIDACDSIMREIKRPEKLIKFASMENIISKTKFKITPRVTGYFAVLLILITTLSVLFAKRKDIDVTILRTPGTLFQNQPDEKVSNIYNFKISNKTFSEIPIDIKLEKGEGEIKIIGNSINVKPLEIYEGTLLIILPKKSIKQINTHLDIDIISGGKKLDEVSTNFLGPQN